MGSSTLASARFLATDATMGTSWWLSDAFWVTSDARMTWSALTTTCALYPCK